MNAVTPIPFDLVGFDLDGTLVDSAGDLGAALNHALVLAGRSPVSLEAARSYVGGGTRVMLERALAANGGPLPDDRFEALLPQLVDYYAAHIAVHSTLYPGVTDMLQGLADAGIKLALVTNKLERLAVKLLEELELSPHFYTIIGGDTLGHGRAKPAPDLLRLMMERSGLPAPCAAYVGDTVYDSKAAQAAGLPVVLVDFGFSQVDVGTLGANAVISHFDQLMPALARIERIGA
ncbi:MAG: HAD-IA family hydrolase [Sphingomonadales bacterium]|nr:HAD-IA family hydrolase [Sphingomonadales bacterium]MDE2170660.1 HAD-IA family hydrolase [Sphingomonadales bacterium]